jgi:hypothetical protein
MTSKRLGILWMALFALWSLAGSGSFVSSSSGPNGLGASAAYAGDPDTYTSTSNTCADGDPDSYTGDPGVGTSDDDNPPPPQDETVDEDDEEDDAVRTIYKIALLVVWSMRGAVH